MSQTEVTLIARHTSIKGDLYLEGPAVIGGRVEGTVVAKDALEISAEGIVEGDIQGELVDIQGTVNGNVAAAQACRLGKTARVTGELRAENLAFAEGTRFVGHVRVGGAEAVNQETDPAEEIIAAQAVTGTIHRLETLARGMGGVAEVEAAVAQAEPTVRVLSQTVQQALNRSPKIIKAH